MGITKFSTELLEKALLFNPDIKSVMELGSQNLYTGNETNPPFANVWYQGKGIEYNCIDLAGDNNALKIDLSTTLNPFKTFDLVTDFGTSEHVVQMDEYDSVAFHGGYINSIYPTGEVNIKLGFYNCFRNKHNMANAGGLFVGENPKTGNWEGHGYNYFTKDFYYALCDEMKYELLELGENAAMGNTINGWNVFAIYRKLEDKEFMSLEDFEKKVYQFIYPK